MAECSCIIGLLHHFDHCELVTIERLEDHIADNILFNATLRADPVLKDAKELYCKEHSLKDYADRRKTTNLMRFSFCPECGKRIDWRKIRER